MNKAFRSPWERLHHIIETIVKSFFGDMGIWLKENVDRICRYIFITLLGSVVQMVTLPMENLIMGAIRSHIDRKLSIGLEMLNMQIHKDLLYEMTRKLLDIFVPSKQ
jgi:hypothetical protein